MLNNTNQSWLQGLNEFIDGKEPCFQRQQTRLDKSQGNSIFNSSAHLWQPGIRAPSPLTTPWNRLICTLSTVLSRECSSCWALHGWLSSFRSQPSLIILSKVVLPSQPGWALPTPEASFPAIPKYYPELCLEPPAVPCIDYILPFSVIFFSVASTCVPFHPTSLKVSVP